MLWATRNGIKRIGSGNDRFLRRDAAASREQKRGDGIAPCVFEQRALAKDVGVCWQTTRLTANDGSGKATEYGSNLRLKHFLRITPGIAGG
jgi:hypothetical protein